MPLFKKKITPQKAGGYITQKCFDESEDVWVSMSEVLQDVLQINEKPTLNVGTELFYSTWTALCIASNLIAVKNTATQSVFQSIYLHTIDEIKNVVNPEFQEYFISKVEELFTEMSNTIDPRRVVLKHINPLVVFEGNESTYKMFLDDVIIKYYAVYSSFWKEVNDNFKVKL